ncbi:MAG: DUF790 family protein, partial [bacterium]|nr:DUF790 family protein [bacterium]
MLTGDLVRPRLRKRGNKLQIEMLDGQNARWNQTADDLITLFQEHAGQARRVWDEALEIYEGERLDYIVIRGLAKVLADDATFTPADTPLPPPELRQLLFERGPVFVQPDLFHQQTRQDTVAMLAGELDVTPQQIDRTLFADRPAEHLLTDAGSDWSPSALISRYNLELARAALYWADEMQ